AWGQRPEAPAILRRAQGQRRSAEKGLHGPAPDSPERQPQTRNHGGSLMKQIIVEITPEGEVQIDAIGFKGTACEKATAEIEKALGLPATRKKKPEYHAQSNTVNTQRA